MNLFKSFFTIFFLGCSCIALSQSVELDQNFGNGGIVITPGTTEIVKTLFTQNDKILSVGYYYKDSLSSNYDWALARYNLDGSLDNSFGEGGLVFNADTCISMPYDMAIQSDNKIIVLASRHYGFIETSPGTWTGLYKSIIVRYNPNGDRDSTFGDNGHIIIDLDSYSLYSIKLLENNQILIVGSIGDKSILLKLNADGSIDNSFGNSGLVTFDDPNFKFMTYEFLILNDGNILCYGGEFLGYDTIFGESYGRIAIVKLDLNGELVTSFGNNGKVLINNEQTYGFNFIRKAIEMDNNQILFGGSTNKSIFLKINRDGSLVENFGSNGIVEHSIPFSDMVVDTAGKIFLVRSKVIANYDYGYSICRFNSNGTIDSTFNNTGYFDLNISPGNDYVQCINIQSDGKLLLSGSSRTTLAANFTIVRIINPTIGIENITIRDDFKFYPNPFHDELNIKSEEEVLSEIIIYDITGQTVFSKLYNSKETSLSLNIPKGTYICDIITLRGKRYTRKIIKL